MTAPLTNGGSDYFLLPELEIVADWRQETKTVTSKRKSEIERLLEKVRRNPSPRSHDPRQLDLEGFVTRRAFEELDREIKRTLSGAKPSSSND